jgi:hypothetical protein
MRYLLISERHFGHFFAPMESGGSESGSAAGVAEARPCPVFHASAISHEAHQRSKALAAAVTREVVGQKVWTRIEWSHCGQSAMQLDGVR